MVWKSILKNIPGYFLLLDPDRIEKREIKSMMEKINVSKASGVLVGTSLLLSPEFDEFVRVVKENINKPVIIFPGGSHQVSRYADAILFMILLSGRNPEFLIGEQVRAAPLIYHFKIEPIPTGYILIESGKQTSVEFMSNTRPIPRDKPDILLAHALAGQYLGLKLIYLDAGSGAKNSIPPQMIRTLKKKIDVALMVGGGIRNKKTAHELIESGADFIVIGNAFQKNREIIKEMDEIVNCFY